MTRELLIKTIKEKLDFFFVERYNEIDELRTLINLYIKDIGLVYEYNYNILCKELIENVELFINDIDYDDIEIEDSSVFIYTIISKMIKHKIENIVNDEFIKKEVLLIHELNYNLIIK